MLSQKTAPFYFRNNFVKQSSLSKTIFGLHTAEKIFYHKLILYRK